MPSFSQLVDDINQSSYRLDAIGVLGLFGGKSAIDALETIHLYKDRRWAGWYNYPGGVDVAMRFGQMANSRLWSTIFPGPKQSPAIAFKLAGKPGPEYNGAFSGTRFLQTGYAGHLTEEQSTSLPCHWLPLFQKDGSAGRMTTSSATVTVISFDPGQASRNQTTMVVSATAQEQRLITINPKTRPFIALWAILPSMVSILSCVFCFLGNDPLCASLILIGIVSSGFSSLVLGTATLKVRVPVPPLGAPAGDGLMFSADGSIIVLKGEEADVNIITKGQFELDYSSGISDKYHAIGISSLFLAAQVLVQFLLFPRCTLFGQIMALISFLASGMYHLFVVSISTDREGHYRALLLQNLLFQGFSVRMEKWMLGTRTQIAVFVCLVLGDGHSDPLRAHHDVVLSRIIPNETPVWRCWRRKVLKELDRFWKWDKESSPYVPVIQVEPEDQADIDEYSHFTSQDIKLLDALIGDAWCVFNRYPKWRADESGIWRGRDDDAQEPKLYLLPGGSPV